MNDLVNQFSFRSNLMQHDTTHINHHQATKNPPNSKYLCGNSQETPKLQMALGPQLGVTWGNHDS